MPDWRLLQPQALQNQDNAKSRDSFSPLQAVVRKWIHRGPDMSRTQDTVTATGANSPLPLLSLVFLQISRYQGLREGKTNAGCCSICFRSDFMRYVGKVSAFCFFCPAVLQKTLAPHSVGPWCWCWCNFLKVPEDARKSN